MATITWKGDDATPDLEQTERFGVVFKKGEAVEIGDERILSKLSTNPTFEVAGYQTEEASTETEATPAPSTVSAQVPFDKPGEPRPKFRKI